MFAVCAEKLTATPLVYSVEVTCTSNGYIADVPIDLDVTATSSASCPTPASLTASVVVDDPPNIDLAAPEAVCVSGATFPAEFTVDEEVNLEDFEDWDVDVKPLDAGGEVTGVTCEGRLHQRLMPLPSSGCSFSSTTELTGLTWQSTDVLCAMAFCIDEAGVGPLVMILDPAFLMA